MIDHTNRIELFKRITGITQLSAGDEKIFRSHFINQNPRYANGWLYMLRATRNNDGDFGYKLQRDGALLFIGYRNDTCYIVNPIGENIVRVILDVCSHIHKNIGCSIVLRKINEPVAIELLQTKNFSDIRYIDKPTWLEDDLFQEHQIRLDKLFLPDLSLSRSAKKLSKKVRRFEKFSITLHTLPQKYPLQRDDAITALFHLTDSHQEKYTAYLPILHGVFAPNIDNNPYQLCIYKYKGEFHGLYISEQLDKDTIGLYCAISSMSMLGLTEWMDTDYFRKLFQDGIKYILLGGSETAGVHYYVQKLLVAPTNYSLFSLLYSPEPK